MNKPSMKTLSIVCSLVMMCAFVGNNYFYEDGHVTTALDAYGNMVYVDEPVEEGSIVGMIVGLLVGVVVAASLLPTIFQQTSALENDSGSHLDTNEENLIGVWNILIIVGVILAIIGVVM